MPIKVRKAAAFTNVYHLQKRSTNDYCKVFFFMLQMWLHNQKRHKHLLLALRPKGLL
jgi:hypothetical protein